MMNGWSIPPLLMASINAYVAVYYFVIWIRTRRSRELLSFAHLALAVGVYDAACGFLYNAATPEAARPWQLAQTAALTLGAIALLVFVADYTRRRPGRFVAGMALAYVALTVAALVGGTRLVVTDIPHARAVELPLGLSVTYNEMTPGPISVLHELVSLGVFVYIFVAGAAQYRAGERARARRLLAATVPLFAAALNDAALGLGLIRSVYVIEYAFMGIVILVADSLSKELVRIAGMDQALQQSQRNYREVFDSAGDAIFVHDAVTGAILDVNKTMLDLYGCTRDEALQLTLADVSAPRLEYSQGRAEALIQRAVVEGPQVFEWRSRRKSGEEFPTEVALKSSTVEGRGRVMAVVRDITERKRAESLQAAVYEIAEVAQQDTTLEELLVAIHGIVGRLMSARNLYVALYDPATNLISFPYFADEVDEAPAPFPPGKGMTSYVLASGKPLLATPEVLKDLEERGKIEPLGAASIDWLGVPLTIGDKTIGVLAVQSYTEGVRYTEREQDILTYVSRQVALAIERKRAQDLLAATNERLVREAEERGRAEELRAAIYEISEAANQTESLEKLFVSIHAIVGRLMNAKNFYIALHDPATGLISFPYFVDDVDSRPAPFPLGRGMTSYVMRTGRPLLATPGRLDELQRRGELERLGGASIDWLGVPLKVQDRIIGVLAVQSYVGDVRYTRVDEEVLSYVSARVAEAIERKKAEQALRESEERYRAFFDQAPVGIYQTTPEGRIIGANPALVRMLKYDSFAELATRNLETDEFEPGYDRAAFKELIERSGEVRALESVWTAKDGTPVFVRETARAIHSPGGGVLYYEGIVEDVSRSMAAEVEHRRLTAAVEQAVETVVITDTEGRIQYVNPAFERITGYTKEEAIGQKPSVLKSGRHDDAYYASMWQAIKRGETWQGHFVNRRKDGTLYEEDATISPIKNDEGEIVNFVAVKRDVTQEVALEDQLRQAQKMEAVGHLAGGVAHDFNNLLQAMLSHTQLLRRQGQHPDRVLAVVPELEQQIQRGAALTRQLLLLSRRETTKRERFDLNDAVRDATEILRRLVRANIALSTALAPRALPVEADRGQLQQELMNLTLNASDAMPDGGALVIRTGAAERGEVWLSVADTGHGIPPSVRDHIFEPFFTTKEPGKGTGLGLSVVHGIVASHGGRIEVESALGEGSTFRVTLPAVAAAGRAEPREPLPLGGDLVPGQGERILLVEDEAGARDGVRDLLASIGYDVVAVASGEDAERLPDGRPFDLLLTDVMRPGRAGPQLAEVLQRRWPALKVVLMSGYARDDAVRSGVLAGVVRFLQKPFDITTLAGEVRAALDERAGSAVP